MQRRDILYAALAFGSVAFLYLIHLDTPLLWADEAENAAMSRNVLLHGYPVGFDGRNLLTYGNCGQLGEGLVSKRVTWLQYYVGAASQMIFGATTAGSRALFAIFGALAFFPLLGLLRSRNVVRPEILTGLLLLAPQVILFQRNGRYFPLLILFSVTLLYCFYHDGQKRRLRYLGAIATAILLFHTHSLMAAGLLFSLLLTSAAIDRKRLPLAALAGALGFGSWLIWYTLLPGTEQEHFRFHSLFFSDFSKWRAAFSMSWMRAFTDLDFSNSLPLTAIVGLLLYCVVCRRTQLRQLLREPLFAIIWLDLFVQTALSSALIGSESRYGFALLRYMPHLSLLLGVALYLLVRAATGSGLRALAPFALISAFNVFGASALFDVAPPREFRSSWWPSVYGEILDPPPDALLQVLDRFPPVGAEHTDVLKVAPMFMADTFTFYMGDELLIRPYVTPGSACERDVIETIGETAYRRLRAAPKFILVYQSADADLVPKFERSFSIPTHRFSPDATRPELNRRGFHSEAESGSIVLYRREIRSETP
jgi:hypothetical protein